MKHNENLYTESTQGFIEGLEPAKFYSYQELHSDFRAHLSTGQNLPEGLFSQLPECTQGWGYHVGAIPALNGGDYPLVPSERDRGYGYGVFYDPLRPQIHYVGGKALRVDVEVAPVFLVPIGLYDHYKLDTHQRVVGCTNGHGVLLTEVRTVDYSLDDGILLLGISHEELYEVKKYQKKLKAFQLVYPTGYKFVRLSQKDASTLRLYFTIDDASTYMKSSIE